MTLLASKQHTAGSTKRWTVNYDYWLDNTAEIERIDVQSSSTTCLSTNRKFCRGVVRAVLQLCAHP
jgi:hypothetical protein